MIKNIVICSILIVAMKFTYIMRIITVNYQYYSFLKILQNSDPNRTFQALQNNLATSNVMHDIDCYQIHLHFAYYNCKLKTLKF